MIGFTSRNVWIRIWPSRIRQNTYARILPQSPRRLKNTAYPNHGTTISSQTTASTGKSVCCTTYATGRYPAINAALSVMDGYTQEDISLLMNHINSTARDSLNGRTPFELASLLLDRSVIETLGLKKIEHDDVCLRPNLLRK